MILVSNMTIKNGKMAAAKAGQSERERRTLHVFGTLLHHVSVLSRCVKFTVQLIIRSHRH